MTFLPIFVFLAMVLFLIIGEPPKKEEEKSPEQELSDAIAKYLAKAKENGSSS
jgi:hypothetical protein